MDAPHGGRKESQGGSPPERREGIGAEFGAPGSPAAVLRELGREAAMEGAAEAAQGDGGVRPSMPPTFTFVTPAPSLGGELGNDFKAFGGIRPTDKLTPPPTEQTGTGEGLFPSIPTPGAATPGLVDAIDMA